jgi:hypothetical protein
MFAAGKGNPEDKATCDACDARTLGSWLGYMGWVQRTIGRGREVFGVIVAKSISENLRYAASMVPNVRLFKYEVEFQLRPANDLTSTLNGRAPRA